MDFGCVTPEYVYRMWGGTVAIEEIANAMTRCHEYIIKAEIIVNN